MVPQNKVSLKILWKKSIDHNFNALTIGRRNKNDALCILTGCEDGVVRIYNISQVNKENKSTLTHVESLETKSGPVQHVQLHNITRLGSTDVVVSDSRGVVTVFHKDQLLTPRVVSTHNVTALQIQQDPTGGISIITGDYEGNITAFNMYKDVLWKLRLSDTKHNKGLNINPTVQSMLAVNLSHSQGHSVHYILVSDNSKRVYVLQEGSIVLTIQAPAVVMAMCVGHFIDLEDSTDDTKDSNSTCSQQVALACDNGAVYVMSNFSLCSESLYNIGLPLRHIVSLHSTNSEDRDVLLSAGDFNAVFAHKSGEEICRYETNTWVTNIHLEDINGDGKQEVVLGCHDNTIHALQPQNIFA